MTSASSRKDIGYEKLPPVFQNRRELFVMDHSKITFCCAKYFRIRTRSRISTAVSAFTSVLPSTIFGSAPTRYFRNRMRSRISTSPSPLASPAVWGNDLHRAGSKLKQNAFLPEVARLQLRNTDGGGFCCRLLLHKEAKLYQRAGSGLIPVAAPFQNGFLCVCLWNLQPVREVVILSGAEGSRPPVPALWLPHRGSCRGGLPL